jgi:hypothetical protein
MEIIVFILLAGVWAAFLLPSFFDHRRQTPRAATRDFARTRRLLASVSSTGSSGNGYARRNAQLRRQRLMLLLGIAAAVSLVIAVLTGSVIWLMASIVIDAAIAVYVALLVQLQQAGGTGVVRLPGTPRPEELPDYGTVEETPTVRVIAG